MDKKALGRKIRSLRRAKKLNQDALADGAGIGERVLQRLEAGKANPELSTLESLAGALDAGLVVLFSDPDEEKLIDMFRLANARNAARILAYAEGLLAGHQPDDRPRLKGSS